MRILIYGHRGWIGRKLTTLFADDEVLGGEARVDDDAALDRELAAQRPERVVCCIGRTHGPGCGTIDYLEQPGRLVDNVRDNLYAPLALALRWLAPLIAAMQRNGAGSILPAKLKTLVDIKTSTINDCFY